MYECKYDCMTFLTSTYPNIVSLSVIVPIDRL